MDLNDEKAVKEFVERTIKEHPEVKFRSATFTQQLLTISDDTVTEFNEAYNAAREELKNKVNLIIDQAFDELISCNCLLV